MAMALTVLLTSELMGGVTNARDKPVRNNREQRMNSAWGRFGWTRRRRVSGIVAMMKPEVAIYRGPYLSDSRPGKKHVNSWAGSE